MMLPITVTTNSPAAKATATAPPSGVGRVVNSTVTAGTASAPNVPTIGAYPAAPARAS